MTLKTAENLIKVLEYLSQPGARLNRAMAVIGGACPSNTIFMWIADETLRVSWPDPLTELSFGEATRCASSIRAAHWFGQLLSEVAEGVPMPVVHNGKQAWAIDPEIVALLGENPSRIDCEVFFDQPDAYLRRVNARGQKELVPLVIYHPAPAHQKIWLGRSLFPELNPVDKQSTEINGQVGLGVLRIGGDIPEGEMSESELREYYKDKLRALRADAKPDALPAIGKPEHDEPPQRPERPSIDINQKPDPSKGFRVC